MSKDLKIILIVFGSLAALVVIAVVGAGIFFVTAISHNVGNATPQSNARDAAKIASFTLPRGYHYLMAMDMAVMNMVAVAPADASARGGFLIQLQGIEVPTGAETDDQLMASMQQSLGARRCDGETTVGSESIVTVSRKTVVLREIVCKGAKGVTEKDQMVEFGRIPSKYPLGMLMAIGTRANFDRDAVRELVQSIR